jgi:hypothetical protein
VHCSHVVEYHIHLYPLSLERNSCAEDLMEDRSERLSCRKWIEPEMDAMVWDGWGDDARIEETAESPEEGEARCKVDDAV